MAGAGHADLWRQSRSQSYRGQKDQALKRSPCRLIRRGAITGSARCWASPALSAESACSVSAVFGQKVRFTVGSHQHGGIPTGAVHVGRATKTSTLM